MEAHKPPHHVKVQSLCDSTSLRYIRCWFSRFYVTELEFVVPRGSLRCLRGLSWGTLTEAFRAESWLSSCLGVHLTRTSCSTPLVTIRRTRCSELCGPDYPARRSIFYGTHCISVVLLQWGTHCSGSQWIDERTIRVPDQGLRFPQEHTQGDGDRPCRSPSVLISYFSTNFLNWIARSLYIMYNPLAWKQT